MLLQLFRNAPTPGPAPPPEPGRAVAAFDRFQQLPALPDTAVRAMALANNPDSSFAEFVNLIMRDGAVASAALKLANSPVHSGGRPVVTIKDAVLRLGMRECQALATAISMRGLLTEAPKSTRGPCQLLWRHGFFTACLATCLNKSLRLGFVGQEFCAGLLHDMGRLLLAVHSPDGFLQADPLDFIEAPGQLEREQQTLGTDHCALGADYGQWNNFPPDLIAVIRHHHAPENAGAAAPLTALVALADDVANHVQRERRIANYDLSKSAGFHVLEELGRARPAEAKRLLPQIVVQAVKETRALLKCLDG